MNKGKPKVSYASILSGKEVYHDGIITEKMLPKFRVEGGKGKKPTNGKLDGLGDVGNGKTDDDDDKL